MAHSPRHDEILQILARLKKVTVGELTERLGVSEVTVRKDLTLLEEQGKLLRTHGGAKLAQDENLLRTLTVRQRENIAEKQAIARRASELISPGETVYIDAGSTCAVLARELRGMELRVVTNSIDVIVELSEAEQISLFSVGGSYRREAGAFIGPVAVNNLQNFQIQTAFLGTTGFSRDGVFTSQNVIETTLKNTALSVSSRRIILANSSKYNNRAFSVFARPDDVDVLVTDSRFEEADRFVSLGIEVVLV